MTGPEQKTQLQTQLQGLWIPVERTEFWDFDTDKNNVDKFLGFKETLQREATSQIPKMSFRLAEYFLIPPEFLADALPPVEVTPTVGGGAASHSGRFNKIFFPIQYALPLFLGQVEDLRQTQFYPTLAHEVGHFVQMAAMNKGETEKFQNSYDDGEPLAREFFAGLCARIICDDMQIGVQPKLRSNFRDADEHIALALVDEQYQIIKALSKSEKQKLAFNPEALMVYIDPQIIKNRDEALEEIELREIERRSRPW